MRGGVSLAVWIGGACGEIDALRRSSRGGDDGFWSQVLDVCDVEDVIVDVMAGASAGGLNGVIYAVSQVYGFALTELRAAWLTLGDLGKLVRPGIPPADPARYPSLLRGDDYFFTSTFDMLRHLIDGGDPPPDPPHVDLTLTATLVNPVSIPAAGTRRADTEQRRSASTFRFRHRGSWLTDFPPKGTVELDAATARLGLAARSTSSYPVAFEGAAVYSRRPPSFGADTAPVDDGVKVDMAGVLGDASSDGTPFVVIDGGVLDNIPLGRALSAISGATADRPTRRVLVYVRPGAPGPPTSDAVAPTPAERDPQSTLNVIRGVVRARIQPETITDDLALIEEHNRRVQRSRRLRLLAFAAAEDRKALRRLATSATEAYLVQRADVEAQEILRLLEDPIGVLGEDPFPASHLADAAWRAPRSEWEPRHLESLDGTLAGAICGRMDASPLGFGVSPVGHLTQLLLEWARFVERSGDGPSRAAASRRKSELYRVLTVYVELVQRPRRLAWVVLAAIRGVDHNDWETDSLDAVEALLHVGAAHAEAVETYLHGGDEAALKPVRQEMHDRLDALLTGDRLPPRPGTVNLRTRLLSSLVLAADSLAGTSLAIGLPEPGPGFPHAGWLHRALAEPQPGTDVDEADLQALEVLAFQESLVGALADGRIQFVELSSASPTPISAAFPLLLDPAAKVADAWASIGTRLGRTPAEIASDNKLAGNELKNFSAFLRERWRANDWMWGRMDAVPTLVELLVTPASLIAVAAEALAAGVAPADAVAAVVRSLRTAVTGSADPGEDGPAETSWPRFLLETAWVPREGRITRVVERAVEAALTDTPDDAVGDLRPSDLGPLRRALVCARQWRILSEELGLQRTKAPLGPRATVEAAAVYRTGLETMTEPHDPGDSNLVRKVVAAGRAMVQENLGGLEVPKGVLGTVQAVGAVLSWSWLGDRIGFRRTLLGLKVAAALCLILLPLAGSSAHGLWKGLALAAVPGAVAVVVGVALWLLKRKAQSIAAVAVGAALVVIAAVLGGNWLASSAVFTVAIVGALVGLGGLEKYRPRPGRPRHRHP
jgi:hypothetical protein